MARLSELDDWNGSSTLIQNRAGAWVSAFSVRNASQPLAGVALPDAKDGEAWANFTMAASGKPALVSVLKHGA